MNTMNAADDLETISKAMGISCPELVKNYNPQMFARLHFLVWEVLQENCVIFIFLKFLANSGSPLKQA